MRFIFYIIFLFLLSCTKPTDPLTGEEVVDFVMHLDTYGEAMDVDLTDSIMVIAANYQGFIVYDIVRDVQGNIESIDSVFNGSDMDEHMGDNRAQKVVISKNHEIAFITDIYDRIWLYKLADGATQYSDNYLSDCYGGTWLSTAIDDQDDHIKIFSLIQHISAEEDEEGTVGDFDQYSTSVVWKGIYDIGLEDALPETAASPSCEFSYNFGILPKEIDFSDSLLAISNGELGINVLKQTDEDLCFDDENNIISDFVPTGDIDYDRIICEREYDEYYNPGLNGIYEPAGGFYPYLYSSFDLPGETNSVLVRESAIFAGLSTSNGCYMSLLDSNGVVNHKLSLANGYTINAISEDNGTIALSAGHDGVLLYKWFGDSGDYPAVLFMGHIHTPYSNNVRVDGNNLLISTEDGLYVYLIK